MLSNAFDRSAAVEIGRGRDGGGEKEEMHIGNRIKMGKSFYSPFTLNLPLSTLPFPGVLSLALCVCLYDSCIRNAYTIVCFGDCNGGKQKGREIGRVSVVGFRSLSPVPVALVAREGPSSPPQASKRKDN